MATLRVKPQSETRIAGKRPAMTRRAFAIGGLAAAGVTLAGCWRQKFDFNQKLSVTVSTPAGEKTASAVTNVVTYVGAIPLSGNRVETRIRGEATVLEVSPGRYLFALIGEETKRVAFHAWSSSIPARDTEDKLAVIEDKRESIVLPPKLYPMLVTFGDINDPASVVEVKPNELDKHFGPGVSLKSINLEITDEPVTEGVVEKAISWIGNPQVMENPNWNRLPLQARKLLGGFLHDYRLAQDRFLKGKKI